MTDQISTLLQEHRRHRDPHHRPDPRDPAHALVHDAPFPRPCRPAFPGPGGPRGGALAPVRARVASPDRKDS